MFQRKRVNVAVLIALGMPLVAMAQETLQRVEITGSRIKTIDTEGASPVVVMTAETIKAEGIPLPEGYSNTLW